jgi:Fe-S-cluster-containing hydrogenase component 2
MHASRNIRLCTKDCLCLYVCPTGASDTENGQIDFEKCIGCGACVRACISHAISMIPDINEYPHQQVKKAETAEALKALVKSKAEEEQLARKIAQEATDPVEKQFAQALEKSSRKQGEDLFREAGYMLPQSKNAHEFLESLLKEDFGPDFPSQTVEELLKTIPTND